MTTIPKRSSFSKGQWIDAWGRMTNEGTKNEVFIVVSYRHLKPSEVPKPAAYLAGDLSQNLQRVSVVGDLTSDPSTDLQQGFLTLVTGLDQELSLIHI